MNLVELRRREVNRAKLRRVNLELRRGEVNLIRLKRANLIELREFDRAEKKRCKKEGKDRGEK